MRLIVDTNIIISALIKDSLTRKILTHLNAEFFTIDFTEIELTKYKSLICKKANITMKTCDMIFEGLNKYLIYIDQRLVDAKMPEAKKIMDHIDTKDTLFIAAALATNSIIWSDDNHFQKQKKIKVLKTKDMLKFL